MKTISLKLYLFLATGLFAANSNASSRCSASEFQLKAAGNQPEKYWTFKCGNNSPELTISAENEHMAELLIAAKAHGWTVEYVPAVVNFENSLLHVSIPPQ